MKFKSALLTQASGSIGGVTFSHNQGGNYTRARAIPTNPNSVFQAAVRSRFSQLASLWVNTLDDADRLLWTLFGEQVPITNSLGDAINLSGLAWYQASNGARMQAGLSRVDAAPTIYSLAELTTPIVASASAAGQTASIVFTNTDAWANETGGALIVQASRGQNPSINFFKGPYRFSALIAGAAVPPTSPQTVALPFPLATDQRVFLKLRAVLADGRISVPFHTRVSAS